MPQASDHPDLAVSGRRISPPGPEFLAILAQRITLALRKTELRAPSDEARFAATPGDKFHLRNTAD